MNTKDIKINNEDLWKIVDNLHDEIMIYDNSYNLLFVNKAAKRHYGKSSDELIGMNFKQLDETYWGNSTLPDVYEKKTMIAKRQITNLGLDIVTIAVPIFDKNGEIKYVAQNVNDIYDYNKMGVAEEKFLKISAGKEKMNKSFIYKSDSMIQILSMIYKIKNVKNPCLILGETGTGKSFLAKCIHDASNRTDKPFVAVNCACICPNLIESELFGYKKGAFSGANSNGKKGIVELADGGTLFLDEISEVPYDLQGKLLHFIQEQEFMPVGGEKKQTVDVKIIAATNRSLKNMVDNGTFRKDLYYRLNTFEITIPPLRERPEDIQVLVDYYLSEYDKTYFKKHTISKKAMEALLKYNWPGNVRELLHMMEKIVVLANSEEIEVGDLPKIVFDISVDYLKPENYCGKTLDAAIEELEKKIVIETYKKHKSSVQVAKVLGVSQPKAYRLIKKYIG